MHWSDPDDLKAQVLRLWDQGGLLKSSQDGGVEFPFALRLRRPNNSAMSDEFDRVRSWIRLLEEGGRAPRGYGYEIEWAEIAHRQLGRNRVPVGAVIPTREDALKLIGKQKQAERFAELAELTLKTCPALRGWLAKKPLAALKEAEVWAKLGAHPRPGLYLRQIDIPGVDTKLIETHQTLLSELLDIALPPESIDSAAVRRFEARYGLLVKRPLVRFRVLDPRYRIGGLSDIATPAPEFAALDLPVERVFITENEINGLVFPDVSDAAVIFGLGYGLDRLGEVDWLRRKEISYWGDIDTHGFAILDRLRATFPNVRSLLMDRETLVEHRLLWVREAVPAKGPLSRLTESEGSLFDDLVQNRIGEQVRLEQERIGFGWIARALLQL